MEVSVTGTLFALAFSLLTWMTLTALYNLYFHPLSRFPGPRTWAITRLPYISVLRRGNLVQRTKELHDKYGDVVRLAPDELSFISAEAWQDIYGHHQGRPNFPKNPLWMAPGENGIHSILSANDADHSRYRRLLAHAFSEKALHQQEYLLISYVELLMQRLSEKCASSGKASVDLAQWFNFTSFDIIGDLTLGESFLCLQESRYHGWVSILFTQFKLATLLISLRFYGLDKVLKIVLPSSLIQKRKEHVQLANSKIHRRLDQGEYSQRSDFMSYVVRYNDEKGMSLPEIEATFRTLVMVGSETTATALTGIVSYLIKTPEVLDRLVREILQAFKHASEIRADRVDKLVYLSAVIEEGLRLCPPVPLGMPRVVPAKGAKVADYWLPGGTLVSASGYSSNRSANNYSDPSVFDPSRWLNSSATSIVPSPAFYPFSLGPRNCLGRNLAYLEMRLILCYLLYHFYIKPTTESKEWMWGDQKSWILWDKRPLDVMIHARVPHV